MKSYLAVTTLIYVIIATNSDASVSLASTVRPSALELSSMLSPQTAQDGSVADTITGNWQMSWTNEKGKDRHATLQIRQDGKQLSGTAKVSGGLLGGSFPLTGGVDGNQISLTVKAHGVVASFTGIIDGGRMSGTTQRGKPWMAIRK